MKVTLNELIAAGNEHSVHGDTFEAWFEGFYYQNETGSVFSSEDITNEELGELQADTFEEFKEELWGMLTGGFNEYNEATCYENYYGMEVGFVNPKGYLYDTLEGDTAEFLYPDKDNTVDMFQCEVITPENTTVTVYVTFPTTNIIPDKEYEVEVELGDNFEDNPGNHCEFGVWVSDKCYHNLWNRYKCLTGL